MLGGNLVEFWLLYETDVMEEGGISWRRNPVRIHAVHVPQNLERSFVPPIAGMPKQAVLVHAHIPDAEASVDPSLRPIGVHHSCKSPAAHVPASR